MYIYIGASVPACLPVSVRGEINSCVAHGVHTLQWYLLMGQMNEDWQCSTPYSNTLRAPHFHFISAALNWLLCTYLKEYIRKIFANAHASNLIEITSCALITKKCRILLSKQRTRAALGFAIPRNNSRLIWCLFWLFGKKCNLINLITIIIVAVAFRIEWNAEWNENSSNLILYHFKFDNLHEPKKIPRRLRRIMCGKSSLLITCTNEKWRRTVGKNPIDFLCILSTQAFNRKLSPW